MRQTKKLMVERNVISSITCDSCNKQISSKFFMLEAEDAEVLVKGEEVDVHYRESTQLDLCSECYNTHVRELIQKLGKFRNELA
jgi:hypothetical protein